MSEYDTIPEDPVRLVLINAPTNRLKPLTQKLVVLSRERSIPTVDDIRSRLWKLCRRDPASFLAVKIVVVGGSLGLTPSRYSFQTQMTVYVVPTISDQELRSLNQPLPL